MSQTRDIGPMEDMTQISRSDVTQHATSHVWASPIALLILAFGSCTNEVEFPSGVIDTELRSVASPDEQPGRQRSDDDSIVDNGISDTEEEELSVTFDDAIDIEILHTELPCAIVLSNGESVDFENDYLPHVIACEMGQAPEEALKAQAVAARGYALRKWLDGENLSDGEGDQVYSCGPDRQPASAHFQAVESTFGQVPTYQSEPILPFYVAGAIPSESDCVATENDPDPTNTEAYVTSNNGLSSQNHEQSVLGWVDENNIYNRGCMSQNGAICRAEAGELYHDILRAYYGGDMMIAISDAGCFDGP